jgi:hypothetical protein
MPSGISAKRVTRVYSAEQWTEARRLYQSGLSLEGVAEKLGIPYSTIQNHAWVESWPVRSRGGQRDPRYQAAQAKRIRRKLEKEEKRLEQELVLVKTEDLELLARRSLAAYSERAKVAVSRRVIEILSRLDASVPVRSAAQALGSLAPILRLLYGWGREPEIQSMKLARTGSDAMPTSLVNLRLVNTSPHQLAAMAKGQVEEDDHSGDHSDDHFDGRDGDRDVEKVGDLCSVRATAKRSVYADHSGDHSCGRNLPSASECNGQGAGPSVGTPQQPLTATHGRPISEKEVPHLPAKQPVQRRWETDLQQAERANRGNPPCPEAPQNALKHSVQQTSVQEPPPTPGSQAWHRLRIEELARLRAEWRGR